MNKFKIGDKVHHHNYGRGTVKASDHSPIPYFVEFDNEHEGLHGGGWNGIYGKDKSCYWLHGRDLTVIAKSFKGNK